MKKLMISAAIGLLALSACSGRGEHQEAAKPVVNVVKGARTEVLAASSVREGREATGTVRSSQTLTLSTKLMGTITQMPVRLGMRVKKGDVIARVDARDISAQTSKIEAAITEADEGLSELLSAERGTQSAILAAEANRDLARSTFGRMKALYERGSLSRQEYDEAEARLKGAEAEAARAREGLNALAAKKRQLEARKLQARADMDALKATLAYDTVVSPVSGLVIAKAAEEGMLAAPGAPLVTIEKEGALRLEAEVDESMLPTIRLGDSVTVIIEPLGQTELKGRVDEIAPVADQASRTGIVKIALPEQKDLKSGYFGRARFEGREHMALLVKKSAIVEKGQLTGVYVVDETQTARLTLVKPGREYPAGVEILSGLQAGMKIVTERPANLSDGSRLE